MFGFPKVLALLFLLPLMFSCNAKKDGSAANSKPASAPVAADVVICKASQINAEQELNGTVLANDFVELRPEISGRIVSISIKEGANVEKDQLLVKLYDEDLQAQLRKNQSLLAIAQTTESRLKKLIEQKGVNQQEYDQALAQVNSIQAEMDYVKAQIRKTEIRSPFAGKIGLRQVSLGAFITPQNVVSTLQSNTGMKVDFNVPEEYGGLIRNGMKVDAIIEGKAGRVPAQVIAVEPVINQQTRNLKVRAALSAKDVQMGAFAKILLPQVSRNSILLPTNAIVPDTRNKKVFVFRNGKVQSAIVETGIRQNENVEIVSGLSVGDTVAVSALLYLRPDSPARVKNVIVQ